MNLFPFCLSVTRTRLVNLPAIDHHLLIDARFKLADKTDGRVRCVSPVDKTKANDRSPPAFALTSVPHPNHNRETFSKVGANYENRRFAEEMENLPKPAGCPVLLFSQCGQKNPPQAEF